MGSFEDNRTRPGAAAGQPAPNWYPDPQDPASVRYWDGMRWTEHTRPLAGPMRAPGYRPLDALGRALIVLFVVAAVLGVAAVVSDWAELSLLNRIIDDPESVGLAEADASDQRQLVIGLAQIALWLGTGIVFIIWFHRAYRNLYPLGADSPRFSAGWAIGAWFVPFLNFVRPKQIMDDIWRGSDPALPVQPNTAWQTQRPPNLVLAWWIVFVAGRLIAWYGFTLARDDSATPEQIRTASTVTLVSDLLYIPAAVLAYRMVAEVTRRQTERAARVAAGPA